MTNQVLVIYNPSLKSQVHTEEWMGQLVRELNHSEQYLVTFFPTTPETTAADIVPLLELPLKLVIAAGGDGTIRFALAALAMARSPIPVALFPIGTGNVLARNLGIVDHELLADPLAHAYDYISNGVPMRIDMGMMNGEFFAGMAGCGPLSDAFMLPERDAKTKGKLVAYMKTLLATIALPPRWFKITTGGKSFKVQASGVFICNVEDLGIGRDTNLTLLRDGVFDLHIINPTILKDYIALTRRYGAGNMSDNPTDTVIRVKEAVVEMVPRHGIQSKFQEFAKKVLSVMTGKSINPPPRDEQMRCMIDGDVHSVTPMRVTVIPKAVNVLVPPARKQDIRPDLVLSNSNSTEVPNIKDNVRKLPKASNQ